MIRIAYTSPFVPVEWIAAHGVRPLRVIPRQAGGGAAEGVCPFAQAFVSELAGGTVPDTCLPSETWGRMAPDGGQANAAIFTTTCDQMRRAPELLSARREMPVFLLNVPATWQTPSAAGLYLDELRRLGRFLVCLGGTAPSPAALASVMAAYEAARHALCECRPALAARRWEEMLCELCSCLPDRLPAFIERLKSEAAANVEAASGRFPAGAAGDRFPGNAAGGHVYIPVAVVGGPLGREGLAVLDAIEAAGARIVLDGTEAGERSLPGDFDAARSNDDPLAALARAYFDSIGDAFRRPSSLLGDWLRRRIDERRPRGIVLVRQVWCDLWHAEVAGLREWAGLPLLDLDVSCAASAAAGAIAARIQAFIEVLR